MTTHNLKDLTKMLPIASAKKPKGSRTVCVRVGERLEDLRPITSKEYNDKDFQSFLRTVAVLSFINYNEAITETRRNINRIFVRVYGQPMEIPENRITDLQLKIKKMVQDTSATPDQMATEIRRYLGYKCSFYKDNNKTVRVTSKDLENAYKLVKQKKPFVMVEDALYF